MTRRQALKLGAGGGAVLLAGGYGVTRLRSAPQPPLPMVAHFAAALPIPPVLQPARSDAGADYYEMTQQAAQAEILPGLKTTIWGYNGVFPGPTIEARRGRRAVVRVTNHLPTPAAGTSAYLCRSGPAMPGMAALSPAARVAATVTRLHGGVTPPESDGFLTDLVPPGSFQDYVYPNQQRATTRLGDIEIWRFVNKNFGPAGGDHPIHVHLVNFQILDRKGEKPGAYESGWKDTVFVPKGEEARVIMRFDGYQGKYMLHCHNLQHEDCAMMTTFQTL